MDFNSLAVFLRVVECGSFTKAANLLRQPKSRISRRVGMLERDLGVSLLYRTTRQFKLTELGQKLYDRCYLHIYEIEAAVALTMESSHETAGMLTITATGDVGSMLLSSVLAPFNDLYPKVTVDVMLQEDIVDLIKEGVDLGIRIGTLRDATLKARSLGKIVFILVASPEYLARSPKIAKLSDLTSHPALVFNGNAKAGEWTLKEKDRREEKVTVPTYCRSNNPKLLLDLAIAGKGVALLPEFVCTDAMAAGRLNRVLKTYATKSMPVQFVWPAHREMSPKVRAFMDVGATTLSRYFVSK